MYFDKQHYETLFLLLPLFLGVLWLSASSPSMTLAGLTLAEEKEKKKPQIT